MLNKICHNSLKIQFPLSLTLFIIKLKKIISGGQSGADRAALDAAIDSNFPCGGFCPLGRKAEDGKIPLDYPLVESISDNYLVRTVQNLLCSDATVIFYYKRLSGGTKQTFNFCNLHSKPTALIDSSKKSIAGSVQLIKNLIENHPIQSLNIAGPRLSNCPTIYDYTYQVIVEYLKSI